MASWDWIIYIKQIKWERLQYNFLYFFGFAFDRVKQKSSDIQPKEYSDFEYIAVAFVVLWILYQEFWNLTGLRGEKRKMNSISRIL